MPKNVSRLFVVGISKIRVFWCNISRHFD